MAAVWGGGLGKVVVADLDLNAAETGGGDHYSPRSDHGDKERHYSPSGGRNAGGDWLKRYAEWLEVPVHSSTIAIFRMLYALCVLAQLGKWRYMFHEFNMSYVVLPYAGNGWVRPVSPAAGDWLLGTCAFAAILQLIGLATVVATPLMWFTFSWLFHICESNHNNHYLLMCHLLFVGSFIGWGRWMSLDQLILWRIGKRRDPRVPRWHMYAMRLMFSIPYFYGAIAKMNYDWLFRAQPLTMWFGYRGGLYSHPLFPWAIAWSGMLFDLVIAPLLWWRKTRYIIAFPGSIMFNTCNKIMFNIGIFPMMMMASMTLFLEPHHPAQLVGYILRRQVYGVPGKGSATEEEKLRSSTPGGRHKAKTLGPLTAKQWWSVIFFSSFLLFHALNPLRHFVLYPSNPSWTEEGHFGAWHMKLRTKRGSVTLEIEELNGNKHYLAPADDPFVNHAQANKINGRPHAFLLYVGRIKMVYEAALRPLKSIKAISCYSLNGRPHHHLYMRDANLLDYVGRYETIGDTAVGKWMWGDEQGPTCSMDMFKELKTQDPRKFFKDLHSQAGLFLKYNPDTHIKQVKRRVAEGVFDEAYLWPMFE